MVALVCVVPAIAQGQSAACTGWCYIQGNMPYCGFTALQEGGSCSVTFDLWYGWLCTIRACSSGPGSWEPENQGSLAPLLPDRLPLEPESSEQELTVTLLEPRT
jgi:hypothetical protein